MTMILIWKCELCEVTVPLTDNGSAVRKCTGGHPDMRDTTGRKWTPDHWPTAMERVGELEEVGEDAVDEWPTVTVRFPSPAESDRLAAEAARERSGQPYRYLDYPSRLPHRYRGDEPVGVTALASDGLADVASDASTEEGMAETVNEYLEGKRHRHIFLPLAAPVGEKTYVPIEGCGCGLLRLAIEEDSDA